MLTARQLQSAMVRPRLDGSMHRLAHLLGRQRELPTHRPSHCTAGDPGGPAPALAFAFSSAPWHQRFVASAVAKVADPVQATEVARQLGGAVSQMAGSKLLEALMDAAPNGALRSFDGINLNAFLPLPVPSLPPRAHMIELGPAVW